MNEVAEYLSEQEAEIFEKYELARVRHKKAEDTREEKRSVKTQKFKQDNDKKRKAFVARPEDIF